MKFEMSNTEINSKIIETVSAREIHSELESKQKFADWIKARINQGGFIEGEDYTSFHNSMKRGTGGTVLKEYFVSLDMAKHLGMMERNSKGKDIRQYFINIENKVEQTGLPDQAQATAIFIESMRKTLRLPDSGMLMLYGQAQQQLGLPNIVPDYAVDAGTITTGSSRATKAATTLLKERNLKISPQKFYAACLELGVVEVLDRPSKKKGIKSFKSITNAGLQYGKNLTSARNQRETSPHWYIDTFDDLLFLLGVAEVAA